ncbi:MrcB family domain-containing protein [Streptacidiphilus sp. BW17]|uniref:MrcB family domain-containing protein n=1 Tax=Streptacidiphilus sp. BW17 TaxID=3156274 RepID=UPI0035190797
MDDLLLETLLLQASWSSKNTPEMKRRGVIVRDEVPAFLGRHAARLAESIGVARDDLGIEGRDGTGLKTEIPWIRVHSKKRSGSATSGWYVVYLFSGKGDRVYLSLNQGTTVWTGGDYAPRGVKELQARVDWARPLIGPLAGPRPDLHQQIDLQATRELGRGYERGNVVAIEYRRDALPTADVLVRDLLFMAELLGVIYLGEDANPFIPGDVAPELQEAREAATRTSGGRKRATKGQGFALTAEQRRAIERHSVRRAIDYFEQDGWTVEDVGATRSYDLVARRDAERLHIEVKGTTSRGAEVVLTRSEVQAQRDLMPANALVVVHSILLDNATTPPSASGGMLHCIAPWVVDDADLTAISYFYRTGL